MCLIGKHLRTLYEQFMNPSFEPYGFWYPMNWLVILGNRSGYEIQIRELKCSRRRQLRYCALRVSHFTFDS
jgi:hypothetical protein